MDAEAGLMRERRSPTSALGESGALRTLAVMGNLLLGPGGTRSGPYLLAGAGVHIMDVTGVSDDVSRVLAIRAGVGFRLRLTRLRFALELSPTYAFTSKGAEPDVWTVGYRSITMSVGF